ncbi:2-oxo acid dehydrogenase subunit E2 [Blastococcus sp. SYSU DS0510]
MSGPGRFRGVDVRPFPSSRRAVTAAVRAGRRIFPMHGLLDVDVTQVRRLLTSYEPPLSMTAYVVAAVARAVSAHPEVHAYRDWRGRLVRHRHVDVQTLVEVPTPQGPFGLVHVVRDADIRGVADITTELRGVKADLASTGTGRAPGVFPVMYAVMSRSVRAHQLAGTVQVTAVGMYAGGGGLPSPHRPSPPCRSSWVG